MTSVGRLERRVKRLRRWLSAPRTPALSTALPRLQGWPENRNCHRSSTSLQKFHQVQAPPEYDHKCGSYLAKLLLHLYSFSFRSYIRFRVRLCAAFLEGRCHKGLPGAEIPAAWFQFFHCQCPPAFGWPGSLCKAAHSQSELMQPGEAVQHSDLHVSMQWQMLRLMQRPLPNIMKSWYELESIPVKA